MATRVSVIVTACNQAGYIKETLDSVLSQSWPDLEVIVVDDASTDGTPEVLAGYGKKIRVIRLDRNSGGPSHPRNVAIREATGDYIAIFDGDDVMSPGRIEEPARFLDEHADIPFVFSNFINFSAGGRAERDFLADHKDFWATPRTALGGDRFRIAKGPAYETLLTDNFVGTGTVMFRRSLFAEIGTFDVSLKRSEDIEYWYRVARKYDFGFINKVLFERRLHGQNISSSKEALWAKYLILKRQGSAPMSSAARATVKSMMGQVLFSLGYYERGEGRPWRAAGYYLMSMYYRPTEFRTLVSLAAVALPRSARPS